MPTVKVLTKYPIAVNSPDHRYPCGVSNDNSTNPEFIKEIEQYFPSDQLNVLDLGCAGGQMIVDFASNGHTSVGLEGSDYALRNTAAAGYHNWGKYYRQLLFNCDVTKPFSIMQEDSPVLFDCITAWEFLEHIRREDLKTVFENVKTHLKPSGIFCGSLFYESFKTGDGIELHQSVYPREVWLNEILSPHFSVVTYPFRSSVRGSTEGYFCCHKKEK